MLNELRQAAERGVRVRLLLDDNGIIDLDEDLAGLNEEPNFEVRLFNPFVFRQIKELGYVFDFVRLNRRMHNKSLTADGAVSILGGRNIGDIYFGFPGDLQFIDTDVMVTGKAACSGLMKPDIYLGDNVRHKEVLYDKQTTYFYSRIQTRSR